MKRSIAITTLAVATAVLLATWLAPQPLYRDPPRDLPWELPDYREADTGWYVDERGRLHAYVEHFRLKGISPSMVAWFYQQLPISTVEYRGKRMPLYHIFHPTEHGRLADGVDPWLASSWQAERDLMTLYTKEYPAEQYLRERCTGAALAYALKVMTEARADTGPRQAA